MTKMWVDLTTPAGVKYGSGPLTTVHGWRHRAKLDKAGDVSFDLSITDAQRVQVLNKRYAHGYTIVDGAITELDCGIIDKWSFASVTEGEPTVHVEGRDLLGELANDTVGDLELAEHNIRQGQYWFYQAVYKTFWTFGADDGTGVAAAAGDNHVHVDNSDGFIIGEACAFLLDDGVTDLTPIIANAAGGVITFDGGFPDNVIPPGRHVDIDQRIWRSATVGPAVGYTPIEMSPTVDLLYFGDAATFNTIAIDISGVLKVGSNWTGNLTPTTATWQYWSSAGGGSWQTLTVEDNTVNLSRDGIITFLPPADWALQTVNGVNGYWVRAFFGPLLSSAGGTSDTWIAEVTVDTYDHTHTAPQKILTAYNAGRPAGEQWTLSGDLTTVAPVALWLQGETCLEALVKVTELTREHFHLGTGRQVVWLNAATADSGLRAVRVSDPIAAESADELCLLESMDYSSDSYDLATRVSPRGSGDGDTVLTLATTSRTAPAGYTLSKPDNYLQHNAAYATYGRILHKITKSEIRATDETLAARQAAADQLFDWAKIELDKLIAPHQAYNATVAKLNAALSVGTTIRVVYQHWVAGVQTINVDADLIVLEVGTAIDEDGARTVALTVSDIASWPKNDVEHLVEDERSTRAYKFRDQERDLALLAAGTSVPNKVVATDGTGKFFLTEADRLVETGTSAGGGSAHMPVTLAASAAVLLDISATQALSLDLQAANTGFLGPAAGAPAAPTFRSQVLADIPAHNVLSATHGDSTAAAAVRGDLITGQGVAPKWARLAISVPAAPGINVLGVANGETESSWKSASSNPGAAASVLQTDTSGYLQLLRIGIGIAPTGSYVLDVKGEYNLGIVARFTESSNATNSVRNVATFKALTDQNMVDGYGVQLLAAIEDSAAVNNNIGLMKFMRDGADNSGKFQISTYNAGAVNTGLVMDHLGYVGIGTAAPAAPVHVIGVTGIATLLVEEGTGACIIELKDAAATPNRWWIGNDTTGGHDNTFYVYDFRQSKFGLKIDTNQNVSLTGNLYVGANKVVGAQGAHIIDADGSLGDITTKFNTLLSRLETHGLLASA